MVRIAAILFAVSLIFCVPALAAEERYDIKIRKQFNLPVSWFACNTTADCAMIPLPCLASLAVGASHDIEAQKRICDLRSCTEGCDSSMKDNTYAACEEGQCVTKMR